MNRSGNKGSFRRKGITRRYKRAPYRKSYIPRGVKSSDLVTKMKYTLTPGSGNDGIYGLLVIGPDGYYCQDKG